MQDTGLITISKRKKNPCRKYIFKKTGAGEIEEREVQLPLSNVSDWGYISIFQLFKGRDVESGKLFKVLISLEDKSLAQIHAKQGSLEGVWIKGHFYWRETEFMNQSPVRILKPKPKCPAPQKIKN